MKKIFLYGHGGSGNHGCEAIVRSTVQIIRQITEIPTFLISSNPEEDENYGVNKLCSLIREKNTFSKWSLEFLSAYLNLKFRKEYIPMDKLEYEKAFNYVEEGDLAFAIGGDNYCYKDVERHIMMHEMMLERGAKTILWGCSIEPDILKNPIIEKDISKYQFITARESVSYRALKSVNKHTFFIHDPAFSLKMARSDVCNSIKKGMTVGINISPMIIENENIPGIVMKNYQKLIEYILKKTEMEIILIPHVVWKNGDDRIPIRKLYEKYENNNRVKMVEDSSCSELKGIISQCRFFIGSRTHATIAAYSTTVPTLVVGYSVKARGIAKDIFGNQKYIVEVQNIKEEEEICDAFKMLIINEKEIKKKLREYINRNEWTETVTKILN